MCGITGLIVGKEVPDFPLYTTVKVLQNARNRGDDGIGLFILREKDDFIFKSSGTALSLNEKTIAKLNKESEKGILSILGHARYGTNSTLDNCNIQPVTVEKNGCKIVMALNGEISFSERWAIEAKKHKIKMKSDVDTVNCAAKLCIEINKTKSIEKGLINLYKNAFPFGGFTFIGYIINKTDKYFFYMRDGLRPLFRANVSDSIIYFSETSHVSGIPAENIEEVPAGEIGVYNFSSGTLSKIDLSTVIKGTYKKALCPFEVAYLQNHSSRLNGHTMNTLRKEFGSVLANEYPPKNSQTISWVPKSGISATQGYYEKSVELGKHSEFKQVVMRKKDSEKKGERSFLGARSKSLAKRMQRKFKINNHEAKGSDIVLIDDSIVRGTVSAWLSKMLHKAKAKKVTFLSAWPPMIGQCRAGIDMTEKQLLSTKILGAKETLKNREKFQNELEKEFEMENIGKVKFDKVGFISKNSMKNILEKHLKGKLCTGCFSNEYTYIHSDNLENKPAWLVKFINENNIEIPGENL